MRSYTSSLVFENLFDFVPTTDMDFYNFAKSILIPTVKVVEANCNTTVGEMETLTYSSEGEIELSTNTRLSKARIDTLLSQGQYNVPMVHLSSCTSTGGICARCYAADFPDYPVPTIGSFTLIPSERVMRVEVLTAIANISTYTLGLDTTGYTRLDIYMNGALIPSTSYTYSGTTLNLPIALTTGDHIVVKYIATTTAPFMGYLADSYSGSLLGVKVIPSLPTVLKPSLLTSIIDLNKLELLSGRISEFPSVPTDQAGYIERIEDPLERSLFLTALYTIYSNVN